MEDEILKKLDYIAPFVNNDIPITIMGLTPITEIIYLANKKKELCRILHTEETDLTRKYRQKNARIDVIDIFQFALYTTASYCKNKFSQYVIDTDFIATQVENRVIYRMLEKVLQASINSQSKADVVTAFGDEISMGIFISNQKFGLKTSRAFALETLEIKDRFNFKVYSGVKP